jgi:hypothetical protein
MFHEISAIFSSIYLVIDGIDEITDRQHILAVISRLPSLHKFNLLIMGRLRPDIAKAMVGTLHLEININMIQDDIGTYIKWRMSNDQQLVSITPTLKVYIEKTLFVQSAGMSGPLWWRLMF